MNNKKRIRVSFSTTTSS